MKMENQFSHFISSLFQRFPKPFYTGKLFMFLAITAFTINKKYA